MSDFKLPRYKCHKEVQAAKIAHIAFGPSIADGADLHLEHGPEKVEIHVLESYLLKHRPLPGGYFVVYEDGYQSFSPAEAFEKGYSPILGELTP